MGYVFSDSEIAGMDGDCRVTLALEAGRMALPILEVLAARTRDDEALVFARNQLAYVESVLNSGAGKCPPLPEGMPDQFQDVWIRLRAARAPEAAEVAFVSVAAAVEAARLRDSTEQRRLSAFSDACDNAAKARGVGGDHAGISQGLDPDSWQETSGAKMARTELRNSFRRLRGKSPRRRFWWCCIAFVVLAVGVIWLWFREGRNP